MTTARRGFASMDSELQRKLASKGGRVAHMRGTAHQFSHQEAVEAGRRGGRAASERRRQRRLEAEAAEKESP
jgi:general stress protein YciG